VKICVRFTGLGSHLFVKIPRQGDSEVIFRSSSQTVTCYYQSNHSKAEAIPLTTLPKDTTSKIAGLSPQSTQTLLNDERQAEKL